MDASTPVTEPPAPSSSPVMDVVRPPAGPEPMATPPAEDEPDREAKSIPQKAPEPVKQPKPPKANKSKNGSVAAAIFATVVIVLGLAALATYAYIKTK